MDNVKENYLDKFSKKRYYEYIKISYRTILQGSYSIAQCCTMPEKNYNYRILGGKFMTVYTFLTDFTFASILILIAQLLRSRVKFFQKLFMPACMIAGFLGLFLGKNFLNIIPFSDLIGSNPGALMILIFTVIGINGFGRGKKNSSGEVIKRATSYMLYRFLLLFIQIAIPIVVVLGILVHFFPSLNPGFGLLLAAGFYGGHGTAAAVGATFVDLGWAEANDLAMTFATAGILTGIFGGLAFIKWATKKGYTQYIKDFRYISGDLKTGLVKNENRKSLGDETIASVSLDSLAFHLCLVLTTGGLGYLLNKKVFAVYVLSGIPDMTIAFLVGLLFFLLLRNTQVYDYIDTRVTNHISGTATDYLVFFGIASIKTTVIIANWIPLLITILVGFVCCFATMIPFGYLMNKDSWFERSIFVFGQFAGVFATGFVLLRIVDPENKCHAVEDTAMTPFMYFLEVAIWAMCPAALIAGKGWLVVGLLLVAAVVCIVLAIVGKMWYTIPLKDRKAIDKELSI